MMMVSSYLDEQYAIILAHRVVQTAKLVRRTETSIDGFLRVRCRLANGDFLEVAIHVALEETQVVQDSYRFQWMDGDQTTLHRRWDMASHYPDLPGFPHHCHIGSESNVEPCEPMDVSAILDWLEQSIL